ncbi:hypothetical protein DMH04_08930 [Kibdelosporangium aridum]|uniref:PPE family protein n=1 Tax=Kibdelosporangium aridum TaxID=2030 RepID=A0A428ZIF7_KIBAR|nr:hypothetical protein [Kibdelosporangium aridum]RSM87845.1 hypothetical protein DMH04_08930 [Kibdelosporangium aridum]
MAGNWLAKPHRQMYEDLHGGPGVNAGEATMSYYDKANEVLQQVHHNITSGLRKLSASWSGAAADGAEATARASAEWASAASVATIVARAQSMHLAGAYVDARNAMPEPVNIPDIAPGQGFPATRVLVDVVAAHANAAAAHARAADVMSGYESSSARFVAAMPTYPEVPDTSVTASVIPAGQSIASRPGGGPAKPRAGDVATPEEFRGEPPPPSPSREDVVRRDPVSGVAPAEDRQVSPGKDSAVLPQRFSAASPGTSAQQAEAGSISTPTPARTNDVPAAAPIPGKPQDHSPGNPGGRGAQPVHTYQPVSAGRVGPNPPTAGRATGMTPGFIPAFGNARNEDKEHERKYVVLEDQHGPDDQPAVAPPVIGEDPR